MNKQIIKLEQWKQVKDWRYATVRYKSPSSIITPLVKVQWLWILRYLFV